MIKEENIEDFHKFIYGIKETGISIPKNQDAHNSINRVINKNLEAFDGNEIKWKINNVHSGIKVYDFTNYNRGNRLQDHLRYPTMMTLKSLHSFLLYFFSILKAQLDSETEKDTLLGEKLEQLKLVFAWIDSSNSQHFETQVLINHILSKEVLNSYFSVEINDLWNLSIKVDNENKEQSKLFEKKNKHEAKESIPSIRDGTNNPTRIESNNEILKEYCTTIADNYKTIKLTSIGFKMPIENFIKVPLKETSPKLSEEYNNLKSELDSLNNSTQEESNLHKEKRARLKQIEKTLFTEHDILEKIESNKDLFIQADAGTGKSTLLRWLAYHYSNEFVSEQEVGQVPIFIKLKDYLNSNAKYGFIEFVKDSISEIYLQDVENILNYSSLLLIDGFDEFSGDEEILIRDISNLKQTYNLQIVFSGRTKPNHFHQDLNFETYNLFPLSRSQIKNLLTNYFDKESGDKYFDLIEQHNQLSTFRKPLFLIFLMVSIKKIIEEESSFIEEKIVRNLTNKGKLFKKLLIDDFINDYEQNKTKIGLEAWKHQKNKELEVLSVLSYHMTSMLDNTESIDIEASYKILNDYIESNLHLNELNSKEVIDGFISHSVLDFFNSKISFAKKEIRIFFTAFYLSKNINSVDDLQEEKKVNEVTLWNNIEDYLFGIIDASKIFNPEAIRFYEDIPIINDESLLQIELAFKLFDNKNYNLKEPSFDEKWLVKLVSSIILSYKEFGHSISRMDIGAGEGEYDIYYQKPLKYYLLEAYYKKYKKQNSFKNKKAVLKSNYFFLHRNSFNNESGGSVPYGMFISLLKYDIRLSYKEILNLLSKFNYHKFRDDFIQLAFYNENQTKILISRESKIKILYDVIFYTEIYLRKSHKARRKGHFFNFRIIQEIAEGFIEYYFKNKKKHDLFSLCRILNFLQKDFWYYEKLRIDSKKLEIETRVKLLEQFSRLISSSVFNRYQLQIFGLISKFDNEFQEEFSSSLMDEFNNPQNLISQANNACRAILLLKKEREINQFIHILRYGTDLLLKRIILSRISNTMYGFYAYGSSFYADHFPSLQKAFLESDDAPIDLVLIALQNVNITNQELNETLINLYFTMKYNHEVEFIFRIIDFFSWHKVKEASPILLEILSKNHLGFSLEAYNTLVQIDPKNKMLYKEKLPG